MENSEKFRIEEEKLRYIQDQIEQEIVNQKEQFERIPNEYKGRYSDVKWGDEDLVDHLQGMILKRLSKLNNLSKNPYFGSFKFQNDLDKKAEEFRIGKTEIMDLETKKILVTDWRTPICTLYYDQSLGRVSYSAPDGKMTGELLEKTQIMINNGKLISVRDTDLVVDDELLLPYLTTNSDSRLKNIIASIQSEQNAIIRKPLGSSIIVQGVAGSGKTTVALHRAAYLLYNSNYKSENFAFLGPNKYFLNYISGLLPDLDTENINQFTFSSFSDIFFDNKIAISYDLADEDISVCRYKNSLRFKNQIDKFMRNYIDMNTQMGICVDGYEVIGREKIQSIFDNALNINSAVKTMTTILPKMIKSSSEDLYSNISRKYRQQLMSIGKDDPLRKEIIDRMNNIRIILEKGCVNEIKAYVKPFKQNTLNFYKNFINQLDTIDELSDRDVLKLRKQSLKSLSSKKFLLSELPAIIYMDILINGSDKEEFSKIRHLIIDEAQDFGLFQYYIISRLFNGASFSIFGDLAQSIYLDRGLDSWEELNKEIFNNKCELMTLDKSYRTTMEITNSANKVLEYLGLCPANPVIRTGDVVLCENNNKISDKNILSVIKNYLEKGYQSIGVICKDEKESIEIKKRFDILDIKSKLISQGDDEYDGGICILTSELSKGLEFDGAIVTDASYKKYLENSARDMHLLYVAMTRALHSLAIFSDGELTYAINDEKAKTKNKKLGLYY